jgi:hypothetical protein
MDLELADAARTTRGRRHLGIDDRHVRWARPLALAVTAVAIAVALLVEVPLLVQVIGPKLGDDFRFYREIGERWVTGGPVYLPHQLAGPYEVTLQVDNLYPPFALLLFVPFVWLPSVLWWAIPIGLVGYAIWSWKPAWWAIPIIALLLAWPKTLSSVLWGNFDMWMMAFVAAGLCWRWPAVFLAFKPSLALFGLIGVRDWRFWAVGIGLVVVSLPLLFEYVTAMRNVSIPLDYSLGSVPMLLLPIVAWLGRRRVDALEISGAGPEGPPGTAAARPGS